MQKPAKIILGIDPGTLLMGFGIIAVQGQEIRYIEMGVLKLSSREDNYQRLAKIHQKISDLIAHHRPDSFAIEAPFFGKNVQSMLKLGRAQGVAIAAAMQAGIPVSEYAPKKVKQSISGNGNAGKDQVMKMMQQLLKFKEAPGSYDATDALAVAVCHAFQTQSVRALSAKGGAKDWKSFIAQNPGRVAKK